MQSALEIKKKMLTVFSGSVYKKKSLLRHYKKTVDFGFCVTSLSCTFFRFCNTVLLYLKYHYMGREYNRRASMTNVYSICSTVGGLVNVLSIGLI